MESLYRFFVKYHVFLVFLLLEGISFVLIFKSSNYQQSSMLARIDTVKGYAYSVTGAWTNYFGLRTENKELAEKISALQNELDKFKTSASYLHDTITITDTAGKQLYSYISAEVVNNSTNKQNNTFIINAGSNQGIEPEMGVISDKGVVGAVLRVSQNFSTVMSVLNTDFKLSARLKKTGHFGPLTWDGKNIREAVLIEVPQHADVSIGDTIVTSSFSSIFPEGIMVGTVSSAEVKKGNFYEIRVLLNADLSSIHYVNVIHSADRQEIKELEKQNKK